MTVINLNNPQDVPIVIFVHGMYSCYLSSSSPPASFFECGFELPGSLLKTFLFGKNGHSDVALPITWTKVKGNDGEERVLQDTDDFVPSDDSWITHTPFLEFLETLNELNLIQLHKIRWDWRRAFEDGERTVATNVERIILSTNSGGSGGQNKKATIISHSTGGVITWPIINKHPEWFQSWINVAGAAAGSNVILHDCAHDFRYSDAKFLKILSKEVIFTCPSQYGFFRAVPDETFRDGDEANTTEFVNITSSTENPIYVPGGEIDLYNVDNWEKFKLGIYSWKNDVSDEEKDHLKNCLSSAKNFRLKHMVRGGKSDDDDSFLDHKKEAYDHLRIICYGTDNLKTHAAYGVDLDKNSVDFEKEFFSSGDQTVPSFGWKRIFGGLKKDIIMAEQDSNHVTVLNDMKLRNLMLKTFFEKVERRNEVQMILDENDKKVFREQQKKKALAKNLGIISLVSIISIIMKFFYR